MHDVWLAFGLKLELGNRLMVGIAWRVAEFGEPRVAVTVGTNFDLVDHLFEWHKTSSAAPAFAKLVHIDFMNIADFLTAVGCIPTFIEISPRSIAPEVMYRVASALH